MSDTQDTLERPVDTGVAIQGEAAPVQPASDAAPSQPAGDDVETRARSQGWVPREEFRGDPDKWRPADEFVKRGEELLPVALERSRAAERKAQELEARLAAQERTYSEQLQRIERTSTVALQRQREQLTANYQHAMRQAVEVGDVARYDQLARDHVQAVDNFDRQVSEQIRPAQQQPAAQGAAPLPPEQATAVQTWRAQNEWFDRDVVLNSVAQGIHMDLLRNKPGMSLAENLAETSREVRKRFPERFGVSATATAPMVESGGGRMPTSMRARAKGASDLPADARAAGEKFVREKIFKDLNDYAREYWADN